MQRLQHQFNSDHQHWNLQRSLAQLVSTSNKRSSSGEMKKRPEEGDIYRGKNFDTCLDQRVWTVKSIFTPFQAVQWSLISVTRCGELLQLSSDTCECVWHMGDEGMTLLNSCLVLKSLACVFVVAPSIDYSIEQVLALQALVEGLGIWRATLGLKFQILLNWVKLRPGIWDGLKYQASIWPNLIILGILDLMWLSIWDHLKYQASIWPNLIILGILDLMWLSIYLDLQLGPAGLRTCSIE